MNPMKYSLILFLMIMFSCFLSAQEITPSLLSTSGNRGIISGMHIEWAVGEIAVTTISNGSYTITQGFLQPVASSDGITELPDPCIKIFPNPAIDFINIEFQGHFSGIIQFYLSDISGSEIYAGTINNTRNYQLDLSEIKPGVYFLTIKQDQKQFTSHKIIKVNESY